MSDTGIWLEVRSWACGLVTQIHRYLHMAFYAYIQYLQIEKYNNRSSLFRPNKCSVLFNPLQRFSLPVTSKKSGLSQHLVKRLPLNLYYNADRNDKINYCLSLPTVITARCVCENLSERRPKQRLTLLY